MEIKGMPLEELKGIGEKTGKLFRKMGIGTVDELLRFYPRDYDAFQDPLPIGQLKEQAVNAVEGAGELTVEELLKAALKRMARF